MLLNNPPLGHGEPQATPTEPMALLLVGPGRSAGAWAERLAGRGHRVELITGHPLHHAPRFGASDIASPPESGRENLLVQRCPVRPPRRTTPWRQSVHGLLFALCAIVPLLRSARSRRPDAIVAFAPGLLAALVALALARALRIPFWFHVERREVELAVATGLLDPAGIPARLARRVERALLRRAHAISCASDGIAEAVRREAGVPEALTLKPWSVAMEEIERATGRKTRRELGAGRRVVALCSGSLAFRHDPGLVVEAARRLRDRRDILFVICGEGPERAALEEQAAGLPNLLFRSLVPRADYHDALRAADIQLLPQRAGLDGVAFPARLADVLASGRPVVAAAGAGTVLAREAMGAGLVVPPGDASALARAVVRLANDRELAAAFGAEGRRRAVARWSPEASLDRFERRVRRLVRGRGELAQTRGRAVLPAE